MAATTRGAWRAVAAVGLAAALALAVPGCESEGDSNQTVTTPGLRLRIRLAGQVVEEATATPVASATVTVCGIGGTATDASGRFAYDIEAALDETLLVRIERSGLATREINVAVESDLLVGGEDHWINGTGVINDQHDLAASDIEGLQILTIADGGAPVVYMRPGEDLHVVVTLDGGPLGDGATVMAFLEATAGPHRNLITAVTASDSVATLANVDPQAEYTVVVPAQDLDGVGGPDFESAELTGLLMVDWGSTVGLNVVSWPTSTFVSVQSTDLREFRPGERPSFLFPSGPIIDVAPTSTAPGSYGANFDDCGDTTNPSVRPTADEDERPSFSRALASTSDRVRVTFRFPVAVLDGSGTGYEPHFVYRRNLAVPTAPLTYDAAGELTTIPATVTDLLGASATGGGTVFEFAASSTLPANEVLTLRFFARTLDGADQENVDVELYRPAGGLAAPTLDNYNGATGANTGSDRPVYLEFGEVVRGSYKVLAIREGSQTTHFGQGEARIIGSSKQTDDSMVLNATSASGAANGGELGEGTGIFYRVVLYASADAGRFSGGGVIALDDHEDVPGREREVTVLVSVEDAEGNEFSEVLTLEVE